MDERNRQLWLAHLDSSEFPVAEYYDEATPFERWCELAEWHERLRRAWAIRIVKAPGANPDELSASLPNSQKQNSIHAGVRQ